MRHNLVAWMMVPVLRGQTCGAQSPAADVNDFKPASTNQPGRQYPQVNSEGGPDDYRDGQLTWRRDLREFAPHLFKD